ncbi:MAG: TIM-barrel domain-containing protein, partial [Muricoprocola sp.]
YVITGDSPYDIVKQFRKIIGRSYIPPKFAFGFGQSRWGYMTEEDFRTVAKKHREHHVPLDMIYMDIDYMDHFKDFTVNQENFKDFAGFVKELKEDNIRLIPIIDAGVKVEKGYDIYDEGIEKGYFCKRADGSEFVATVWPGETHFPDVLNKDAREWFGSKYQFLLDQGIEGFWNDMNEPAIFHTPEGLEEVTQVMKAFMEDPKKTSVFEVRGALEGLINSHKDYKRCFHNVDGKMVCHEDVHNLFGYNMTRAAGEAFERLKPEERVLMFSRSSYIGMHRYGGIWMGDNLSWWSHILLNLKMLPSLNMVGILYTGADLGGFASNTSRDLVLRWLALGVFTPLMRNHSAAGTREQEFYQFEDVEDFAHIIGVRYRLIPYLYSEYMKAALNDDMMFKPLSFVYREDEMAAQIEDQLILGNEVMIAPVYTQNADGRYVYLPETMKFVKFCADDSIYEEELEAGVHYVKVALNEVPLFIRAGKCIPVAEKAECVKDIDTENLSMIGFSGASYELYEDDGIHKDYENPANYRVLQNVSGF